MQIRKAGDRGRAQLGWLDSKHTFSFGHYHDPLYMGFGPIRVINEDRVAPGGGFPTHPHSDMEIISYVLDGALEHRDSLGTGSVIRPGEVQRMSAGTGIRHSEFNASNNDPVHFLQIWIVPEKKGLPPSYEQKSFGADQQRGKLRLVGSRTGRNGSVTIYRDVDLYVAMLDESLRIDHALEKGRGAWIQIARGRVTLNGETLSAGDGVGLDSANKIALSGTEKDSEVLLFDFAV